MNDVLLNETLSQDFFSSYSQHHPIPNDVIEAEFRSDGHGCLHGIRFDALNINSRTGKIAKGTHFFLAETDFSKPLKPEGDILLKKHLLLQIELDEEDPSKYISHHLTSYTVGEDNRSPLSVLLQQ